MTHDDNPHDDPSFDETISDEERAEAEALARAIDRGHGDGGEGLAVAAMIRYAVRPEELSAKRSDAILEEVFAEARPVRPVAEPRGLRWLFAPALALAAGAFLFVLLSPPAKTVAMPTPPAALLEAQARVAAGGATSEIHEPMRQHRASLYQALEEAYLP